MFNNAGCNNGAGPLPNNGARPMVLTKAELIEEVARITESPRKEAAIIVEHILDTMVHAIARGDKVEIRAFGSFHTRQRRARIVRNPQTGSRVEVPGKRIPFFKPSRELREVVMKLRACNKNVLLRKQANNLHDRRRAVLTHPALRLTGDGSGRLFSGSAGINVYINFRLAISTPGVIMPVCAE